MLVVFVFFESCERLYHEMDIVYLEDGGFYSNHCYDELQSEMMLEAEAHQGLTQLNTF